MEACELVESGSRQEDLAAVVSAGTLRTGHHDDWVAAVVFVEAPRGRVDTASAGGEHCVGIIVVEGLKSMLELESELIVEETLPS